MSSNFGLFATELRPLIHARIVFLLNILWTNWQNETKVCIPIIIDKIYIGIVIHCFAQICNRVTALVWHQNLGFAQYLENELTKWDQTLLTHYHWQDLHWYCKSLFFANLQQSYGPWLMSEFGFYSISLERIDRIRPNFVYTSSLTISTLDLYIFVFRGIATELRPLIHARICIFTQYLVNELTKWDQSLYNHYHWQDLHWYCNSLFCANLQQSYGPCLTSKFGFCSISWEWINKMRPNFINTLSLTRSTLIL